MNKHIFAVKTRFFKEAMFSKEVRRRILKVNVNVILFELKSENRLAIHRYCSNVFIVNSKTCICLQETRQPGKNNNYGTLSYPGLI